tara:strand:+ start:7076 stop:7477 length:402 start_codon:yes stop_codon:yes gene_type:complete
MITIEDIEVGKSFSLHGIVYEIIDYTSNKTIVWVTGNEDGLRPYLLSGIIENNAEMVCEESGEDWVPCPVADISFSTEERIHCRIRDSILCEWEESRLVFVTDGTFLDKYIYVTEKDRWVVCEIKRKDLIKFF